MIITKTAAACSRNRTVKSHVSLHGRMQIIRTLLLLSAASLAHGQMTADQKAADFTSLSQFYLRHYTPANWKIVQFGFDLSDLRPWLDRVRATKNDLEYYDTVIDYLGQLRDGHVRYTVPSTFQAYLRFDVDIYDGKVLIEFISPSFSRAQFPIALGDEVVSVDGRTAEEWIERFLRYSQSGNERATRRRAADYITFRPQQAIPTAPELGETAKVVIRNREGEEATYDIPWQKLGEPKRKSPPVNGPRNTLNEDKSGHGRDPLARLERRRATWGLYDGPVQELEAEQLNTFELEMRSAQLAEMHPQDRALTPLGSPIPLYDPPGGFRLRLGGAATDFFVSGTFPVDGKTIGWIRIPSFSPNNQTTALNQFRTEIRQLEALTDALVIDVMHNPGGNVCFAQELLRYLIPQPFWGVGYWVRPSQQWKLYFESRARAAQSLAPTDWQRILLDEYKRIFTDAFDKGEESGVYPICSSSLTALPQDIVYTKPIMLLTNEFSVSAGDAFPALFQDAARGRIVGYRTGGWGGNVNDFAHTGITEVSLRVTRSLMVRENPVASPFGPTRFIENTGVSPDVTIDLMTRDNLMAGGLPFVNAMVEQIRQMLQ